MKILSVAPYSPVPPIFGGALRIYHLLKQSAVRHEVTLAAYGAPESKTLIREALPTLKDIHMVPVPWPDRWRRLGQLYTLATSHSFFYNQLVGRGTAMQRTIDRILDGQAFDIVQCEFAPMGCLHLNTDAVKILDEHNVEYDNVRRMWVNTRSGLRKLHYYREYRTLRREEIRACRQQDVIFTTSERDKWILDEHVPEAPKYVVPNGVDMTYFTPSTQPEEPCSLVFTGMMAYLPNHDGMMYFLDRIFPRIRQKVPHVKVYIVGSRPPKTLRKYASNQVIITGYVDDVRPYVRQASVYVAPLRMGGGTRLKILEAMAMKKPIVTTTIGCEGIEVRHGQSVLIGDDPQVFADAVIQLLQNSTLRKTLIEHGYDLVRSRYEWSVIQDVVDSVYENIVEGSSVHEVPTSPESSRQYVR